MNVTLYMYKYYFSLPISKDYGGLMMFQDFSVLFEGGKNLLSISLNALAIKVHQILYLNGLISK